MKTPFYLSLDPKFLRDSSVTGWRLTDQHIVKGQDGLVTAELKATRDRVSFPEAELHKWLGHVSYESGCKKLERC